MSDMALAFCAACASAYGLREEELAAVSHATGTARGGERKPENSGPPSCTDSDGSREPPSKQPKLDTSSTSPAHSSTHLSSASHHAHSPAQLHSLCPVCLGVLEKSFIDRLAESIVRQYEGYVGVRTFCLALSTPLSLLARKAAMDLLVRKNTSHPPQEDSNPPPDTADPPSTPHDGYIKEELRFQLIHSLGPHLFPPLTYDVHSPFQISVKIDHESSLSDCTRLTQLASGRDQSANDAQRSRGRRGKGKQAEISAVTLTAMLGNVTAEDFEKLNLFSQVRTSQCAYNITFTHKPIFIAGRYRKYSRTLPQTPWVVDGARKAETSVQELIQEKIVELISPSEVKFSSSGREDVDVRMLGNGRPFLLELVNPRRVCVSKGELASVEAAINGSTELVAVSQLMVVGKDASNLLKQGEEDKIKVYCATIWTPCETTPADLTCLTGIHDLMIHQKTPIRVLHRRSLATRERTIHSLRGEWVDPHHFLLHLSTQAGTYIKEFVHGDFGRTHPSLRDLLNQEVDILTLDVEEVALQWPPTPPTKPEDNTSSTHPSEVTNQ